jgi:2-oxoglutarate ferredoxin oxidoreductase subunit alpha
VNGSGSASANRLFARSIIRMGVPIASRNIFPSNIQGLPTWYEVRVSGQGHLGRRGGVDFMVAMNPQTWDKDVASIEPGGYLFYDSTRPMPASKFRDDLNLVGMPLTQLTNAHYQDPRQRQLFKNIIYVGALAQLLGVELDVVQTLIAEQFKGKEKLIPANYEALQIGHAYAAEHLPSIGLKVERSDAVGERIFIEGNDAAALGCVYGGATVAAWYPITPSTSLAEAFAKHCGRFRVDRETGREPVRDRAGRDELASIGMVIGAAWNGARAFTATSGPGISLMQEFIGLAYFAEVPAVIFDVQRGGPSTGMPTRTQQSDILISAYASHGDTKHVLLFPEDPRECFRVCGRGARSRGPAQTPVFVLLDLDIGMNEWLCEPLSWDDSRRMDRGKVLTEAQLADGRDFGRYLDVDQDGIPYRTYPGTHPTRGSFFTRGTSRDRYARYTEEGAAYIDNMQRLLRKFETAKRLVPQPIRQDAQTQTRLGAIYFGSTSAAMTEALGALEEQGIALDIMRVRAFPFADEIVDFILSHDQVLVVEQNRDAQLRTLLINEAVIDPARLIPMLHYDGTPITARFIVDSVARHVRAITGAAPSQEAAE